MQCRRFKVLGLEAYPLWQFQPQCKKLPEIGCPQTGNRVPSIRRAVTRGTAPGVRALVNIVECVSKLGGVDLVMR